MNENKYRTIPLGERGERAAANFLEESGHQILHRNWRWGRVGEIDIIAAKNGQIIFVEVKTRQTGSAGSPEEAVDERKLRTIKLVALHWLREHPHAGSHRYDIVGVCWKPGSPPAFKWLQDVGQ